MMGGTEFVFKGRVAHGGLIANEFMLSFAGFTPFLGSFRPSLIARTTHDILHH